MFISMTEKKTSEHASKSVIDLFKAYYKYSTLTITQKMTVISVSMVMFLMFFSLTLFALLFLGISLGYWIGGFFDSPVIGFLVLSGIFFLSILMIYLFRKIIIRKLRDMIVRKIYN